MSRTVSRVAALSIAATLPSLLLTACGEGGAGPIARTLEGATPPERVVADEGTRVRNVDPREELHRYDSLPERGVRLLFLDSRAATSLESGSSAWADHDNDRVVLFDDRGVVEGILQGRTPDGLRLEQPVFVADTDEGILAVGTAGRGILFRDGRPLRGMENAGAVTGGAPHRLASSRTVFDIPLRPIPPDAPLLWRHDGVTSRRGLGRVVRAEEPLLASLVNSGWTATTADGATYFASAVRPELRRYRPDGTLAWVAEWDPGVEVPEPRFQLEDGGLAPDFRLFQQAMALGADDSAWLLVPAEEIGTTEDRILVFDDEGTLVREGWVPNNWAVFTDDDGRLYVIPPEEALSRTEASTRDAFPPFDLPRMRTASLGGDDEGLHLEDLRGRVGVVNFWASWCAPCRKEMPLLDAWYRDEADRDRVEVVGINEDVDARAGVDFLDELGGVAYPVLRGEGDQRERYRYRGLPYTVVLDRQGRIVRTFYGFGTSIQPIVDAVEEELDLGETVPTR